MVKMAEVLVKIAVMMMAPGSAPAPPEARGREAPFFFFFLDLLPRWAKGKIQSELRISGYKRNGARAESENAETER